MAYQILSPDKLSLYKPDQYLPPDKTGAIFLKEGVKPITGTFKVVGNQDGTLTQTLPKTLPTTGSSPQVDNLTAMQIVLQQMGALAQKQGLAKGTEAILGGFAQQGITPEHQPGSFAANIVNFVEQQTGNPIQQQLDTMNQIIEGVARQKDLAQNQIDKFMSNGIWSTLTDDARKQLWQAAGYTGTPTVTGKTAFEHFTDADGHVWNVQYDAVTGNIISKTDFGPIGKGFKPTGGGGGGTGKDELKARQDFSSDLADPTGVGIKLQIAANGEEKDRPDLYISRETLIQKLYAKYSWAYPLEDVRRAVYDAYPDSGGGFR